DDQEIGIYSAASSAPISRRVRVDGLNVELKYQEGSGASATGTFRVLEQGTTTQTVMEISKGPVVDITNTLSVQEIRLDTTGEAWLMEGTSANNWFTVYPVPIGGIIDWYPPASDTALPS